MYEVLSTTSPIWAFSRFKIVKVMWCMTWVFHWAEYTKTESLAEVSQDHSLNETYDDQGFGINITHLKKLHALKILPNTARI